MELILWRHAEAEEGYPDAQRKLTKKGQKQAQKMSAWLNERLPQETLIIASPTRRTQETVAALERSYETNQDLAPGCSMHQVLNAAGWPAYTAVLVVGHQPVLGEVVERLLGGMPDGFSVKKGSVWWLSNCDSEDGAEVKLVTVMYPKMLP